MSEHLNDEDSGTSDEAWRRLTERCRRRAILCLRLFRAIGRMPPDKQERINTRWRFVMAIRREALCRSRVGGG